MLYKCILGFVALLMVFGCGSKPEYSLVPFSALLANPERHDGDVVVTTGILGRGGDIFLTKDHAEANDRLSALFLSISDDDRKRITASLCMNGLVEVKGEFGLVRVNGFSPRLGFNRMESIVDKKTHVECLD